MKHILLTAALCVTLATSFSQTFQWVKQLGGTSGEAGRAVCTDGSGNVISAGLFTGTFDANPGAGTSNLTTLGSGNSGYISKIDSNGNFIWGIGLMGAVTGVCEIYGVASDATGNVYVTGTFNGTVDFDPGAGTTSFAGSPSGIFIAKYTSAGALTWVKVVNGVVNGYGISICVDASGNVITAGRYGGSNIDFDPGAGTYPMTAFGATGVTDGFVLKLNSSGNFVWAFKIGDGEGEQSQCVRTDASGNIYVAGSYSNDYVDFDPGVGTVTPAHASGTDGYVAKYSSAGVYQWVSTFKGTGNEIGYGIAIDASLNVYMAGAFQTTADVDPGATTMNFTSAGSYDILIWKLNSSGAMQWAKQIGGTGIDLPTGIAVDVQGQPYLSGYFESAVDFDPSSATVSKTSFGLKDAFVLSLNSSGGYNWVKQIGGTTDDYAFSIATTTGALANIYTTGSFTGTGNFNSPSTSNLTSLGAADAYVHRMSFNSCTQPTTPTVNSTATSICAGAPVTLSIATGNLNSATNWQWYTGGCGTTSAGSGTSITVSPTSGTTYSVRAEGGCVTPGICGTKTISVTTPVTPTITISTPQTAVCAGASVTFTVSITGGGAGPTYQWKKNGVNITGATASTYTSTTLANNDQITCALTSNLNCATPATVTSNSITITIATPSVPTIAISTPQTTICSGASVTFTAAITNGGTTPAYQWKKGGVNITGATSATYTTTTLTNNDQITCAMTSNAACVSPATVTSNSITITVNTSVTPTIVISAAQTNVCPGDGAYFTSVITNGGNSPAYQWKKNGVNVANATSSAFSYGIPVNGDVITCVLTSNALCATSGSVTSNSVTLTVGTSVTPTIAITGSPTTICAGATASFTSTITNGGTTPAYQWKIGNTNITGATSSTYTTAALNATSVVTCVLTSNATCASPANVTSNVVVINVNPAVTPAVSIAATQSTICSGNTVTFTATPTNGGTAPGYQWKKNGANITGATSATYSSSALVNNDQISCVLTSNASCSTTTTATSNTITIAVSSTVVPAISVSATNTTVCTGESVTFTATPTNGGSTPTYQWKKNGTNITGATSVSYTTSTINNQDAFSCVLTSSVSCASPTTATSNTVTITVNAPVAPAISISTPQTTICAGASVTFTSTITNGGVAPVYQWKKGGIDITGATSSAYTATTLVNSDQITCVLTSNAACVLPATATSNAITMVVNPAVTPIVSITATQSTICAGNTVTFTATPTNGGTTPAYQWKKNGTNVTGATSFTYSSNALVNNDQITCVLTSNASCLASSTATSNAITIAVSSTVVPVVNVSAPVTVICSGESVTFTAAPTNGGASPTYQWKRNGTNISGAASATYTTTVINDQDAFSCVLTSSVSCASPATAISNDFYIGVYQLVPISVTIDYGNNSICQGGYFSADAVAVNAGNSPTYQWKLNGADISGETNVNWGSSNLVDGDEVTVEVTSSVFCASPNPVTSPVVTVSVGAIVSPSVTISASQTTICSGTSVTFTATPTNGGNSPAYAWKLNGNLITGAGSATYTSSTLSNSDQITCVLYSNESCVDSSSVTSNAVTISTTTTATASVSVTASDTVSCSGEEVLFTALPFEGGSAPVYQWKKNATDISGATSATYTTAQLNTGDQISCEMTSNSTCVAQPVVLSPVVQLTVNALPDVAVTVTGNVLSVTPAASHQWLDCNLNAAVSGATNASYTATANGNYKVAVVNAQGCADTSTCQTITGVGIESVLENTIHVSPNPFTDNISIDFSVHGSGNDAVIEIFNSVGQLVSREKVSSTKHVLDLSSCTCGFYLLQITEGSKIYRQKVLKQ